MEATAAASTTGSRTIADLVANSAVEHGEQIAVRHKRDGVWHDVSYVQLANIVQEIGLGLIDVGIQPGERLCILANTRPEWSYVDMAATSTGAVVVPIYPTNSPEECLWVISDSGATTIVCENEEQCAKIAAIRDQVPQLKTVIVIEPETDAAESNGGSAFHPVNAGNYIGELEFGSVSVIRLGDESHLRESTAAVVANNLAAAAPNSALPRLKHVFLVIRENRTYDEILGDLPGGDGDPKLARWGMKGWLSSAPQDKTIPVTPNAHALAQRFGTSDRFLLDSDVSADGHRWVMGAAPTPWFHVAWTSNYGGRRTGDPFSAAPGRRALTGNDAPMPEDEPVTRAALASAGLAIIGRPGRCAPSLTRCSGGRPGAPGHRRPVSRRPPRRRHRPRWRWWSRGTGCGSGRRRLAR